MEAHAAIVIFDSKLSDAAEPGPGLVLPCQDGLIRLQSFAKRGRPKRGAPSTTHPQGSSAPSFEFVHSTSSSAGNVDRTSKRRVRSHVMRKHRQKLKALSQGQTTAVFAQSTEKPQFPKSAFSSETNISHEFLGFDPFDSMPIQLQSHSLAVLSRCTSCVVERIFPIENCGGHNPMKDYFLPLALNDSAVMHAMLFSAGSIILGLPGSQEMPRSLVHLQECIRQVNERLRSTPPVVTDGTIAIVATVAYVEKSIGNHKNWEVHMQGLREIIRQRGGMSVFRSNRILYSKIQRADLCGTMDGMSGPYLEDLVLGPVPLRPRKNFNSKGFCSISDRTPFADEFHDLLCRTERATEVLTRIYSGDKMTNGIALRDELTLISYNVARLVRSQNQMRKPGIEHVSRLALLLYVVTVADNPPQGVSTYDMLATRVITVLEEVSSRITMPHGLRWWIALLISLVASGEENRSWARKAFDSTESRDGIVSREDVRATIASFFWVERIHGHSFNKLWASTAK